MILTSQGGTSGCLITQRLASHPSEPTVLLVEAGREDADDPENLIPGLTKPKFGSPNGNWIYSSTPQKELNDRIIAYPRGKGLGGCSANNFMAWVRGPKCDYDDWADAVDDEWWRWDNLEKEISKLEDFQEEVPEGMSKYALPTPAAHGEGGPITIGYGKQWQPVIHHCVDASVEAGHKINTDNNDGDPLGVSVAQFNVDRGVRVTSATAFLNASFRDKLRNLVVVTGTLCSKICINGKTISGVKLIPSDNDRPSIEVQCRKEVILSAGTFQSAQLLLLSGIGAAEDLVSLDIPCVHDLPAVGRNMRDHTALACEFIIRSDIAGHHQLLKDPKALQAATEEYQTSQTGPLAMFGASAVIIFPILEKLRGSKVFASLPKSTSTFLKKQGRPSTEIWMHSGPLFYTGPCPPEASVLVIEGLCQNNLSKGVMKLASKDPLALPIIDIAYLSHPYDLGVAIETVREIVRLAKTTAFSAIIESALLAPGISEPQALLETVLDTDASLEHFVRETLTQGFHAMSTCIMGSKEDSNKVVTSNFKVDGIEGLRVADMSVCPILTSNHTQINAYLIGQRCSELILEDLETEHSNTLAVLSKL